MEGDYFGEKALIERERERADRLERERERERIERERAAERERVDRLDRAADRERVERRAAERIKICLGSAAMPDPSELLPGFASDASNWDCQNDESSDDSDPDDGPESDNSGEYGYSAEEKLTTHLRFRVGDRVEAKRQSPLGPVWFSTGRVTACFQLIEQGDAFGDTMIGRFSAYAIELDCDDSKVWAPRDHDRYVRKGSSEKPAPAALREEAMSLGYDVSDMDDVEVPPHTPWYAPLRFTVGQKVLANGQTGTITQQWYREERLVCVSDLAG
jgi:hypothetical protein